MTLQSAAVPDTHISNYCSDRIGSPKSAQLPLGLDGTDRCSWRNSTRTVGLSTDAWQLLEYVRHSYSRRDEEDFQIQPIYEDFIWAHGRLTFDPKKSWPECYATTNAPGVTTCALDTSLSPLPKHHPRVLPEPPVDNSTGSPDITHAATCRRCEKVFPDVTTLNGYRIHGCKR